MDLVDEHQVALGEVGQDTSEVTCALDLRAARGVQLGAHRVRDQVGQRRFAQAGGTTQQHMIERFAAQLGGLHHDHELVLHLRLPMELLEVCGAQREVEGGVGFVEDRIQGGARMAFDLRSFKPSGKEKRAWDESHARCKSEFEAQIRTYSERPPGGCQRRQRRCHQREGQRYEPLHSRRSRELPTGCRRG